MREIKHLSIHQWIRFAIPDSQQPTSPIGFLFLKLPPPPCAVLLVYIPGSSNDQKILVLLVVYYFSSESLRNLRIDKKNWNVQILWNLHELEGIPSLPAHAACLGWKSVWGSGYDLEAGIPPCCPALRRVDLLYGAVHAQHRSKPWLPDFWLSEVVLGRVQKSSCCEQWLPVWLNVGRKAQRSVDKPKSWTWHLRWF